MVQSMNTKVDLTVKGTSYLGLTSTGKIMIGDQAFEYYNDRKVEDFIQIPWNQIDYIAASVYFNRWINRFAIFTYESGHFSFACSQRGAIYCTKSLYEILLKPFESDTIIL